MIEGKAIALSDPDAEGMAKRTTGLELPAKRALIFNVFAVEPLAAIQSTLLRGLVGWPARKGWRKKNAAI